MQKGAFDDAARMYQDLVRAVPGDAGLLTNLGMALAMGGHEQEAIGPLERAVKLKPALIPAQLFLGSSYLALGEGGKAVPLLKRVVAADPANVEYRHLLARAYAESDRPLEAAEELRAITRIAPKLPGAWYALFHAYNDVAQEAVASFAAETTPPSWQDLLLADALLADGRFTDA